MTGPVVLDEGAFMTNTNWMTVLLVAAFLGGCDGAARGEVSERTESLEAQDAPEEALDLPEPEGESAEGLEVAVRGVFVAEPAEVIDADGDGFTRIEDQDDENPFAHPGAYEMPCNGVDEDGDTVDDCPADADGDGVSVTHDCDDLDVRIGPFMSEVPCDGVDQNCDGRDDCDRDEDGVDDADDLDPDDPNVRLPERRPVVLQ